MRRLGLRGTVALLVAVLIVGVSSRPALAAPASAPTLAAAAGPARLDGETLFRGLAFGQGPVAKLFPELASAPVASPAEAAAIDAIVAQMRTLDPRFFDHFGVALQTGDRFRIRAALEDANVLGQRAIIVLSGQTDPGLGVGDCVVLIFVLAIVTVGVLVAALVRYGAVYNVAVAIRFVHWFFPMTSEAQRQSALARDVWANKIAKTLRATV